MQLSLEEARRLLGWSAAKLAAEAGLNHSAIYDIEQGRSKNPGYMTVARIVMALKSGGLPGLETHDIFALPEIEPEKEAKSA